MTPSEFLDLYGAKVTHYEITQDKFAPLVVHSYEAAERMRDMLGLTTQVHELISRFHTCAALHKTILPETYQLGDIVKKKSGAEWVGRVVGFYSTHLTPHGVAVESIAHPGSVQIYPEHALTLVS